jgi:hypothetical protein
MSKDQEYWKRVRAKARELKSDGCSGVLDIYVDACYEHDIAYRTGRTVDGEPLTRAQADARFRRSIQHRSPFGFFSPVSWTRWVGVRIIGKRFWKGKRA